MIAPEIGNWCFPEVRRDIEHATSVLKSLPSLNSVPRNCAVAAGHIHNTDVVDGCGGERQLVGQQDGISGLLAETDVSVLEPSQGDPANRHGESIHVRCSLLCGGGHCAPGGHALASSARHRRVPSEQAGVVTRHRARLRSLGLWGVPSAWARGAWLWVKSRELSRRKCDKGSCCSLFCGHDSSPANARL